MSTFPTALVLLLFGLAMFYPIFFYPIAQAKPNTGQPKRFLRINYSIHLGAAFISVILLWLFGVNYPLQLSGLVFCVVIVTIVLYYWNRPIPKWNLFTASLIFGFIVYYRSINEIVEITPLWPGIITGLLSAGAISFTILFFCIAMTQSIRQKWGAAYISRMLKYLYIIWGARIAWGILVLFSLAVETQNNETIKALNFFLQVDTLKFILLIFFGLFVPILLFIVFNKELKSCSTPSNVWFKSILLISIISADFLYKYFLLQYGIVL